MENLTELVDRLERKRANLRAKATEAQRLALEMGLPSGMASGSRATAWATAAAFVTAAAEATAEVEAVEAELTTYAELEQAIKEQRWADVAEAARALAEEPAENDDDYERCADCGAEVTTG
jgi:hypothetical protein